MSPAWNTQVGKPPMAGGTIPVGLGLGQGGSVLKPLGLALQDTGEAPHSSHLCGTPGPKTWPCKPKTPLQKAPIAHQPAS